MNNPEFRLIDNPAADPGAPYGGPEQAILNQAAFARASREIRSWPDYEPTPLRNLVDLAQETRVARVFYKDEGLRFGLKSFKALGGAYAVLRVLQDHLRNAHGISDADAPTLGGARYRGLTETVVVTAATDGNHGRSVAWGARLFGCHCVIFLHAHVSGARAREIARYGAEIRRVPGNYDDSVRACIASARKEGWQVIQDTALASQVDPIPCLVMQGYQVLIDEALAQMPTGVRPSHVLVQAGVGGLAAAIAGYLWERQGQGRPRLIAIEPIKADCVYRSIAAGKPIAIEGDIETFMACLAAGEVSALAWPILRRAIDHVVALDDAWGPLAMRRLAAGGPRDPAIVAGESGSASVAGLLAVSRDEVARARIGLDEGSIVLAIGSEGATDEDTYARVVGRSSAEVAA